MSIPVIKCTPEEMERCTARFAELTRVSEGLPDMSVPEGHRTFLNVLGFEQPSGKGDGVYSPFGDKAHAHITHLKAGFGLSYVAAEPGKGVLMHAHDTVETFLVINGRWKVEWGCEGGVQTKELGPLDFIACPIGVERRFECVTSADGSREGLLLGITAGDSPGGQYSVESMERIRAFEANAG